MLVHTGLSVRDIAAATGFTDERHLIRRFRQRTGLTPRAFRDGRQ
jgi:transcriptional regulator GlxA family with amidase domain